MTIVATDGLVKTAFLGAVLRVMIARMLQGGQAVAREKMSKGGEAVARERMNQGGAAVARERMNQGGEALAHERMNQGVEARALAPSDKRSVRPAAILHEPNGLQVMKKANLALEMRQLRRRGVSRMRMMTRR